MLLIDKGGISMKRTMLGVIDGTIGCLNMKELTTNRSIAAVPFGGRYRLIDFALSSMVNSGIQSVAIFPKHQYRSLMDHLGSGRDWDLNRKRDGLFFFPPPFPISKGSQESCLHYFQYHLDYFNRSTQDYVVLTNSYTVSNIDFRKVLDHHIECKADITTVRQQGQPLNTYLLSKELLLDLISTNQQNHHQSFWDVVKDFEDQLYVETYEYTGYVATIDSIESYYKFSMGLLKPEVWKELFLTQGYPILTKVKDEPPTRYMNHSNVKNSLIANGCVIEGHVENSIIFRSVKIAKGAVVKNSIVMQKSQIHEGANVEGVIIDKDVGIGKNEVLRSENNIPLVIKKGTKQGVLMNT